MAYSTRDKIKAQWKACMKLIENIKEHLLYIQALGEGQSDHINRTLPAVYYAIEQLEEVFKAFREGI